MMHDLKEFLDQNDFTDLLIRLCAGIEDADDLIEYRG